MVQEPGGVEVYEFGIRAKICVGGHSSYQQDQGRGGEMASHALKYADTVQCDGPVSGPA